MSGPSLPGVKQPTDGPPAALLRPLDTNSNLFRAAVSRLQQTQGVLECWLRGGSMGTAVPAGSRIRIAFVEPSSYRAGQVIAYLGDGRLCVHRIVHRGRWRDARNWLITKGDRCFLPDAPVHLASVLGPVSVLSSVDGSWMPPGGLERANPAARVLSFLAVAILIALLESDVSLAQSIVARLRRGVGFVRRRVRSPFRGARLAQ